MADATGHWLSPQLSAFFDAAAPSPFHSAIVER